MAKADILNIMYSKNRTPMEFNFEQLTAPPLFSLISMEDEKELYRIATSLKYSGKIKQKYKEMDAIMQRRGFYMIGCGTNRRVYGYLENKSIVAKVAIDKVGLRDNPDEMKNQFLLKPFVTKIFDVSPSGVICIAERVQAITSREEYISIADDIFDLINKKIIGKYVLEDIGTDYFMNVGLRTGFGPVFLDFPYVFELDDKKLYCDVVRPDGSSCNGVIDYDAGFNNLVCTTCNKRHLATSLKKENSGIKIISEGDEVKMKVVIKRGRDVVKRFDSSTDTIVRDNKNVAKEGVAKNKLKVRITGRDGTQEGNVETKPKYYADPGVINNRDAQESVVPKIKDIKINKIERKSEEEIDERKEYESHKIQSKAHVGVEEEHHDLGLMVPLGEIVESNSEPGYSLEDLENIVKEEARGEIEEAIKEELESEEQEEDNNPNITENVDLLKKYNISEEDFDEDEEDDVGIDSKEYLEEKYSHLEEEYETETHEKIINTKDLY